MVPSLMAMASGAVGSGASAPGFATTRALRTIASSGTIRRGWDTR
jgi:hypothetical protein